MKTFGFPKQFVAYRFSGDEDSILAMEPMLKKHVFTPLVDGEAISLTVGFAPMDEDGNMVRVVRGEKDRFAVIQVVTEEKKVRPAHVDRAAKGRLEKMEAEFGGKLGRKQVKAIKEEVEQELLLKAVPVEKRTTVWFDFGGRLLMVAGGRKAGEAVVEFLIKTCEGLRIQNIRTGVSPSSWMTSRLLDWFAALEGGDTAHQEGESVDGDLLMEGLEGGVVSYKKITLQGDVTNEISRHLGCGMRVVRMGMTIGKMSFVLTDGVEFKSAVSVEEIQPDGIDEDGDVFNATALMACTERGALVNRVLGLMGEIEGA